MSYLTQIWVEWCQKARAVKCDMGAVCQLPARKEEMGGGSLESIMTCARTKAEFIRSS